MRGAATGLRYGMPDSKAMSYISDCLRGAPRRPVELYARGGWYVTDDLREVMRERAGNLEGIAMVWSIADRPRAVYQWNHDLEFNRDVVACLDPSGSVTRSESKYTPGDSEPKQRWVYIHTLTATGRHGNLQGSGRFTDAQGHPMGRPHLTSEVSQVDRLRLCRPGRCCTTLRPHNAERDRCPAEMTFARSW